MTIDMTVGKRSSDTVQSILLYSAIFLCSVWIVLLVSTIAIDCSKLGAPTAHLHYAYIYHFFIILYTHFKNSFKIRQAV